MRGSNNNLEEETTLERMVAQAAGKGRMEPTMPEG